MIHLNDCPDFAWVQVNQAERVAKACVDSESFWIRDVERVKPSIFAGAIDNDLIFEDGHGLKLGDNVTFQPT